MLRRTCLAALAAGTLTGMASAQIPARERKPDLGDVAEGRYFGDVISDSKGSSHDDVTLTITRIGVNKVKVTSDYARLPEVQLTLTRALDKIVQASGNTAFVYDWAKRPAHLDVSFNNEVSWSGVKR